MIENRCPATNSANLQSSRKTSLISDESNEAVRQSAEWYDARVAWRGASTVLRRRGVVQLLASESVFDIGTLSHTAAMAWVAYHLTDSTFWVGAVAGVRAAPMLLLPIFAGATADRFDRRRVIGAVRLFQTVVIAVQAVMIGTGTMDPWHQLVFALLSGSAVAISGPAIWAFLSDLVEPRLVPRANAMLTFVMNTGEMVGPLIAGVTIASLGPAWVFALIAATHAVGAYLIVKIPTPPNYHERLQEAATTTYWQSLIRGVTYARRKQPIPWLFALIVSTNVFGVAVFPLIPDYAHNVFGQSGTAFGMMFGAFGLGMLTGSVLLALGAMPQRLAWVLLVSSAVWDVGMVTFGFSPDFVLSLLTLYAMGISGMFWVNAALILFQRAAPGTMRARVMSIYTAAMGLFPLGWLYGGTLATWVGNELTLIISALGGTPIVIVALLASKELRRS